MHYHPITEDDKQKMLEEIGVATFQELLGKIPATLRNPRINVAEAISEWELQTHLKKLASQNKTSDDHLSFLGGGSYEHFIPAAVAQIIGRNEFYTAYTPYQPEAAQGTLQSIFEYQSLIAELTGLDVSNASHYDGATSLAEAALVALRHTDRTKVLLSRGIHPHYREVVQTYLNGTPYSADEFSFSVNKTFTAADLDSKLGPDIAAVVIQTPNFFGVLEDLEGLSERLHQQGILLIVVANPLSLGVLRSPGDWGADVAVGEGQPLGIPQQFGGPYLGYFAVTRALMRRIPGRLAGLTRDADGKRAFCLTLQAREQHIRRERAASNICTNQALCALAACVYMTLMGKQGIREVAELNMDRAYYLRQKIGELGKFKVDESVSIFNEFVVKSDKPFAEIEKKMIDKGIFAGIDLARFYPELRNEFLVCATETKNREQLDYFSGELAKC